jgi:DNA-binding transcriptional regulator WhiA
VSRAERDLVEALRAEVAGIDPSRPCDRRAESAGLAGALPGRRSVVDRLRVRLRRSGSPGVEAFDWDRARDHCRSAWLRGRFLARGSLSLASGRTHLEFVVEADEAPILSARVAEVGLPASWRIRRGRGVVTWKSADTVGTFLRRIGAGGALLELEARQVSRALRGELNRVLNAESANLQRAVGAAGRQLAAIDLLESDGRLRSQPYTVRLVAHGRRETPEATLGELADRLELHRSAVQRALERVERLALEGGRAGRRRTIAQPRHRRATRAATPMA